MVGGQWEHLWLVCVLAEPGEAELGSDWPGRREMSCWVEVRCRRRPLRGGNSGAVWSGAGLTPGGAGGLHSWVARGVRWMGVLSMAGVCTAARRLGCPLRAASGVCADQRVKAALPLGPAAGWPARPAVRRGCRSGVSGAEPAGMGRRPGGGDFDWGARAEMVAAAGSGRGFAITANFARADLLAVGEGSYGGP